MIVDASVLVLGALDSAAYPDKPRLRQALASVAIRESLVAPALAAYELGHAVHRKRAAEIGGTVVERIRRVAAQLILVELQESGPSLLEQAGRIAEGAKVSFYDASYLAHATAAGTPLLTADTGLGAHARALGIEAYVLPEDFGQLERSYPPEASPGVEPGAKP